MSSWIDRARTLYNIYIQYNTRRPSVNRAQSLDYISGGSRSLSLTSTFVYFNLRSYCLRFTIVLRLKKLKAMYLQCIVHTISYCMYIYFILVIAL